MQVHGRDAHLEETSTRKDGLIVHLVIPQVRQTSLRKAHLDDRLRRRGVRPREVAQSRRDRRVPVALRVPALAHRAHLTKSEGTRARRTAKDGKCVRALESEGAHAGAVAERVVNGIVSGPHGGLPRDRRPTPLQLENIHHVLVQAAQVHDRSTHAQTLRRQRLDDASHASGRLRVTTAGLHAGEDERGRRILLRRNTTGSEHGARCADLNRVTKRRARAVHLQASKSFLRGTHVAERRAHHLLLRWSIRSRQGTRSTILIDRRGANKTLRQTVWQRVAVPEQQSTARLGPDVAIRCTVKRFATAVLGQHSCALEHCCRVH